MKFPNESYNLTTVDFSRMKGFSPREVFKKIFVSSGRYSLLDYSLSEIETKYQGISINEAYLNRNLFEFGEKYLNGYFIDEGLERNRIYAPFFLSEWEGDTLFGYVVKRFYGENDGLTMKYSCILGNLTTNDWVMPPHRPKPVLEQNKGMMGRFKEGVPGGWFSDRLILFPMLSTQPTLNHPEGI
jgi:hypothetical protein